MHFVTHVIPSSAVRPQGMCNYLKLYFAGVTRLKGREGRRGGKRRKGDHDIDKSDQGIFQQTLSRSGVNGPRRFILGRGVHILSAHTFS